MGIIISGFSNVGKSSLKKFKDINYIDGADHGYTNKENILAEEIVKFINKI